MGNGVSIIPIEIDGNYPLVEKDSRVARHGLCISERFADASILGEKKTTNTSITKSPLVVRRCGRRGTVHQNRGSGGHFSF